MKKTIAVLVLLLAAGVVVLLLKRQAGSRKAAEAPGAPARGSLSLSGAWALYPLAVRWQEEFQKSHPGTIVDVQAGGAGKGIADALTGIVDIGMVSREILPAPWLWPRTRSWPRSAPRTLSWPTSSVTASRKRISRRSG